MERSDPVNLIPDFQLPIRCDSYAERKVNPGELLDGLKTIDHQNRYFCSTTCREWIESNKYIEWAKEMILADTDCSRNAALVFAKRAVCREVDTIVVKSHMYSLVAKDYKQKLKALQQLECPAPTIIRDLILEPRNQSEHEYLLPTIKECEHAVEVAELIVERLSPFSEVNAPVFVLPSCNVTVSSGPDYYRFHVDNMPTDPLVLVDICNANGKTISIIFPNDREILTADLFEFEFSESIELGKWGRSSFASSGFPVDYLAALIESLELPHITV